MRAITWIAICGLATMLFAGCTAGEFSASPLPAARTGDKVEYLVRERGAPEGRMAIEVTQDFAHVRGRDGAPVSSQRITVRHQYPRFTDVFHVWVSSTERAIVRIEDHTECGRDDSCAVSVNYAVAGSPWGVGASLFQGRVPAHLGGTDLVVLANGFQVPLSVEVLGPERVGGRNAMHVRLVASGFQPNMHGIFAAYVGDFWLADDSPFPVQARFPVLFRGFSAPRDVELVRLTFASGDGDALQERWPAAPWRQGVGSFGAIPGHGGRVPVFNESLRAFVAAAAEQDADVAAFWNARDVFVERQDMRQGGGTRMESGGVVLQETQTAVSEIRLQTATRGGIHMVVERRQSTTAAGDEVTFVVSSKKPWPSTGHPRFVQATRSFASFTEESYRVVPSADPSFSVAAVWAGPSFASGDSARLIVYNHTFAMGKSSIGTDRGTVGWLSMAADGAMDSAKVAKPILHAMDERWPFGEPAVSP